MIMELVQSIQERYHQWRSLIYGTQQFSISSTYLLCTLKASTVDEQNRKHATGRAAAKINFMLQRGRAALAKN